MKNDLAELVLEDNRRPVSERGTDSHYACIDPRGHKNRPQLKDELDRMLGTTAKPDKKDSPLRHSS